MSIAYIRGEHDQAKSLFQSSDGKLEIIGNCNQRAGGLILMSRIALEENQPKDIIDLTLRLREIKGSLSSGLIAEHDMLLGVGYYLNGDRRLALENIQYSLDLLTEMEDWKNIYLAYTLQDFSFLFISIDPAVTSRLLGAIYAYHRSFSTYPIEPYLRNKLSERIKAQIGEDEYNNAFAEGEKMSIKKAIELTKSLVEKL